MLDQCRDLLSQEISLSNGEQKEIVDEKINLCFETEANVSK